MLLAHDLRLARRVGALTLLAIAGAVAGLMFLLDRGSLGPTMRFRVLLRHSAGLRDHAPLIVGGQPVGRIAAVSPMPHGAPGPLAGDAGVVVTVELAVDQRWKVPAAATIFVASRGALSERYLEVAPPRGDPGPAIADGAELRGVDPPTLDNVLQRAWNNLTTFRDFVDTVGPELTALRAGVATLRRQIDEIDRDARPAGWSGGLGGFVELADAVRDLAASARRTYDPGLGGAPGVARLVTTVAAARATIAEIRAELAPLRPRLAAATGDLTRIRGHLAAADPAAQLDAFAVRIRAALDRIDPLLAAAGELADRIARGEGSIGRLLRDPEFPEDTKELGKIIKRQIWRVLERPPD